MEKSSFDRKEMLTSKTEVGEVQSLREKFLHEYARQKGWDPSNLSPNQMIEIVEQNGFKNPGLILG
jgi:hypothetical protein